VESSRLRSLLASACCRLVVSFGSLLVDVLLRSGPVGVDEWVSTGGCRRVRVDEAGLSS
jgi:hypothetical protein